MYFLDTNTCIYFLNGRYESVKNMLLSTPPNEIGIPVIVKAELLLGVQKSTRIEENLHKVEEFLQPFKVVSFSDNMAYTYAKIREQTESKGTPIGPNDLFIASIVMFSGGTLITHNVKEFERIEGLKINDWVR